MFDWSRKIGSVGFDCKYSGTWSRLTTKLDFLGLVEVLLDFLPAIFELDLEPDVEVFLALTLLDFEAPFVARFELPLLVF